MQMLFIANGCLGTPTTISQALKFSHSRLIYRKEIADGALSSNSQRGFFRSPISIRSEGNRRSHPPRSTNRTKEEADRAKDPSTSDGEDTKSSSQDEIIALFRRIQSSISKGKPAVPKQRNLKSKRGRQTSLTDPVQQSPAQEQLREKASRTVDEELLPGRTVASIVEVNNNASPSGGVKFARPVSNFVKRSPIPPSSSTEESSTDDVEVSSKASHKEVSDLRNINEMKLQELKELARKKGIKGYSKMKKGELLDLLKSLP